MTTTDERPGRSGWRAAIPTPTTRAGVVVVVASLAALVAEPLGLGLIGLLVVALVVDAVRTTSPDDVGVEREAPAVLPLAADGEIVWQLRNPSTRPLVVSIADELAPSLRAEHRRATATVPAGGQVRVRTGIQPVRRGRFSPVTMTVRTLGPWGLVTRQADRSVPGQIEVHPSFRSRREAELRVTRSRILEVGLRAARARGAGTDFDRLREYVPGDEVRRVDWAATARSGHPVVRTYREERNQQVLLLLDTGRTMAGVVDGVPRLDHMMDAAMALTTVASHLGDRVGLIGFDDDVHRLVAPSSSRGQLATVTQAVFDLEPRLVESDHRGAFRTVLSRFRRRALLVLLTEIADEAVAETLIPALPLVLRDHELIVVAVRDPELARLETVPATRPGEAYTSSSAAAATLRRDHTVGVLQRMGVTVVDAGPGDVAVALADAYLDLKARGRL